MFLLYLNKVFINIIILLYKYYNIINIISAYYIYIYNNIYKYFI
jgi:hypothetical protein